MPATVPAEQQRRRFLETQGRHPDSPVLLDDVPEYAEEDQKNRRVSSIVDTILELRPVLVWWKLLQQRDDVDAILACIVIPKGVAGARVTFRDLVLAAIWQQASFPEDFDDVDDGLLTSYHLGEDGDLDEVRQRMAFVVPYIAQVDFTRLEAVLAEFSEGVVVD